MQRSFRSSTSFIMLGLLVIVVLGILLIIITGKGSLGGSLMFVGFGALMAAKEKEDKQHEITDGIDASGQSVLFGEFCTANQIIDYLIQGADIGARDLKGQTPLHAHVQMGHLDIVNILISNGADVNAKDLQDRTPLFLARNARIADGLVQKGADINAVNKDGETVLTYIIHIRQSPQLPPHEQMNMDDLITYLRSVGAQETVPEAGPNEMPSPDV